MDDLETSSLCVSAIYCQPFSTGCHVAIHLACAACIYVQCQVAQQASGCCLGSAGTATVHWTVSVLSGHIPVIMDAWKGI